MFVVRRLQEVGCNAGVPFFMSFMDLQKAYNTVDHTLLWQLLTPIGIPRQVLVRPVYGVCSDWFEMRDISAVV